MKATRRFAVLVSAILLSGTPLRAQAPSVLEQKERLQGPPLWVSAEAVADEEKIVNLDLIKSPSTLGLVESVEKQRRELGDRISTEKSRTGGKPAVVAIPASECESSFFAIDDRGGAGLRGTLAELATYSRSIVRGIVRSVDMGFSYGTPSSLVGVDVSDVLKGPILKSPFYIDYPVAHFSIGPFYFCNATKGFEPSPGDEVLLFDYTGPVGRDEVLYIPLPEQIFFQSQDGTLSVSPPLKDAPDLKKLHSLDEIVDRLGALLAAEGGAR